MHNERQITYAQAVNEALHFALDRDPKVLLFGLGTDDPKRLFGTTVGLAEKFGADRVFDMPTSENGMTGVAVGLSLLGFRPVMTHQRLDFFLLAMDQLVNNAAKWHYMFGGQDSVGITIRLILGRGWGQGPTHSQSLQAWFAHIPGLKVVMPSTAEDARGLLLASIWDPNPVLYLEHRWLHNAEGAVTPQAVPIPIGKARFLSRGNAVTIVSMSYLSVEALRAVRFLESHGVTCDLVDLRSIAPLDWALIQGSIQKTGRLLVLDTGASSFGVGSEIISRACTQCFGYLKSAPEKLASPDFPVPTSYGLSEAFYPTAFNVANSVCKIVGKTLSAQPLTCKVDTQHDIPGDWFKGPF